MSVLKKFIPFGAPKFTKKDERELINTLRSGWIGMGPRTELLEKEFARFINVPYAVAVSSCTAALHLSLIAADVQPGDEVITTPLTFVATANAIAYIGAKVRFADVDLATYNLTPQTASKYITAKTAAIIPVHFGGLPADIDGFNVIARKRKIAIIEDAAHAVAAKYKGKMVGASGNLVNFSFYPNKNFTTCEGGMITLHDQKVVERLKRLRLHGLDVTAWKRFHRRSLAVPIASEIGFKYNLTDLQSALGIHQLEHLEEWQRKRETFAKIYDSYFNKIPGIFCQFRPTDIEQNRHALHLYTLRLDQNYFSPGSRDRVVRSLLKKKVGASIHYYPLHLHPMYQSQGFRKGDFPVAEKIGREIFTLPLTPHLTRSTIISIAKIVEQVTKTELRLNKRGP